MINRYKPHLIVIPEDDADRQLAIGFIGHPSVADPVIQVDEEAKGWPKVLTQFRQNYVAYLEKYSEAYIVLLIDFDTLGDRRREWVELRIPDPVKDRVFLIGSRKDPEDVKRDLRRRKSFEKIGFQLADECFQGRYDLWNSPHFTHNAEERARLAAAVKSFLFTRPSPTRCGS